MAQPGFTASGWFPSGGTDRSEIRGVTDCCLPPSLSLYNPHMSNEPISRSPNRKTWMSCPADYRGLQRGRVRSNAESTASPTTGRPMRVASTGPRSIERGKSTGPGVHPRRLQCFNGAAFDRTRKAAPARPAAPLHHASTGPRSIERGKLVRLLGLGNFSDMLQRGRVRSNAESSRPC